MKKITLFVLLISSLYADATIYFGASSGAFYEKFDDIEAQTTSAMAALKVGYGDIKAYAVEFSIDYAYSRSKIFSSSPSVAKDGDRIGFNVSLLKAFDFDIYVLPFAKLGFGTGLFDIKRELQSSLSYGTFNFAAGTFIPLSKHFDAEIGYEVRHTSFESINNITTKVSHSSNTNIAYMGINYRF